MQMIYMFTHIAFKAWNYKLFPVFTVFSQDPSPYHPHLH